MGEFTEAQARRYGLLPIFGLKMVFRILYQFEGEFKQFEFREWGTSINNFTYSYFLVVTIFEIIILYWLGAYLDQIYDSSSENK